MEIKELIVKKEELERAISYQLQDFMKDVGVPIDSVLIKLIPPGGSGGSGGYMGGGNFGSDLKKENFAVIVSIRMDL